MFMKSNAERTDIKAWVHSFGLVKRGEHNYALSRKALRLVSRPKRTRVSVSLHRIDKATKEGEIVLVPGKVLHTGKLGHRVKISALSYSAGAKESLKASGSNMIGIEELLKSKGVRIIV